MQRNQNYTRYTYAHTELTADGKPAVELREIEVPTTDEKKTLKKAFEIAKELFNPLKVEDFSVLLYMHDDFFYRFAEKVDGELTAEVKANLAAKIEAKLEAYIAERVAEELAKRYAENAEN